jgi:hypothetical protein
MNDNNILSDVMNEHIKNCKDSSARTRYVIIIIVMTSILILVQILNSNEGSWMSERYEKVKDGFRLKVWNNEIRETYNEVDKTKYDKAKKYALDRQILDSILLKESLLVLNKIQIESMYVVRIPFWGIFFDINDLGLIGGFTLLILMCWLKFCLVREYLNLKNTINAFPKDDLDARKEMYNIVSSQQVFTIPPPDSKKYKTLKMLPQFLFLLPLVDQLLLFINDLTTLRFGISISQGRTYILMFICFFLLLFILIFTIQCYLKNKEIDTLWADASIK